MTCPSTGRSCPSEPTATENADGTITLECCPKQGPCPLDGYEIPYAPCKFLQGTDCLGDEPGRTCLPTSVKIYDSPIGGVPGVNYPRAEVCECADGGACGPISIQNDPGTDDYMLVCFGDCPTNTDPPQNCQVHLLGVPQGQYSLSVSNLLIGDVVTCRCAGSDGGCTDGAPCGGDFDRDGDVDLYDLLLFESCSVGPSVAFPSVQECARADGDRDGDVDLKDLGSYQRCFSGTDIQADPNCGE